MNYVNELLLEIDNKELASALLDIAIQEDLNRTYAMASSSGGRYHKETSNGVGGLFNHTREMLALAKIMIAPFQAMHLISSHEYNILKAAIILHDGWKYQNQKFEYQMYTTKDHPHVGYLALQKHLNKHEHIKRIADLVRLHQSAWSGDDTSIVKDVIMSDVLLQILVHCDMLSSRKNVIVEVNVC